MSLNKSIEKLKYILEEMEVANYLASTASDDASARLFARHVIIRAENLIAHARRLKKPLKRAGYKVNKFHLTKEAYALEYESYFSNVRNKLGAHIQDFDFLERIEIWNEIEIIKVDYFANDAISIYRELEKLSIPGLSFYDKPSELEDPNYIAKITEFNKVHKLTPASELCTDPLAISRPNTMGGLNMTQIHIRAGQLNLIRRWINSQFKLYETIKRFTLTERIIKTRVITDIVSFWDCLITRNLDSDSPQRMDGLDNLLKENGESVSTIEHFLRSYKYEQKLDELRSLRNRIGAHLEIEQNVSIEVLVNEIDSYPFDSAIDFFMVLEGIFLKLCSEVIYLNIHRADGQHAIGVITNNPNLVPYGHCSEQKLVRTSIETNFESEEIYEKFYLKWKHEDPLTQDEGRHYFFNALMSATTIEKITKEEKLTSHSSSYKPVEYRKSHDFILDKMLSSSDDEIINYILPLIRSCATGDPRALTEMLLKFTRKDSRKSLEEYVCASLGIISGWYNQEAREYLENFVVSCPPSREKLVASLALFIIYVRTEGIFRINKRAKNVGFQEAMGWLFDNVNVQYKITLKLVFLSNFYSYSLANYEMSFDQELKELKKELKLLIKNLITDDVFTSIDRTYNCLIDSYDYVGIALLLHNNLKKSNFRTLLVELACSNLILTANHDQALSNTVICNSLCGYTETALNIAKDLASRNPNQIDLQILLAQVLAEHGTNKRDLGIFLDKLKANYNLSSEEQSQIVEIEKYILG